MAKIDSIFKKEIKKAEPRQKRVVKWIHFTKLVDHEDQYCNEKSKEEIEALADLIEADGEILQDLLVKRIGQDEYKIIAGHKRRRACKLLAEKRGLEQFSFCPCYVMDVSDVQAEFRLYSSNGYHEKTEYEKMRELERMRYLLEHYPDEFPQARNGRMVERLAKLFNMKKTTVGEYLTISKNLGDKAMDKFQDGTIKKSAALELASMRETDQDKILDQGITKLKEIKEAQKPKKEKKASPIDRECITGKSPYGNCVCCGKNDVECCVQCDDDCNGRCGWIDAAVATSQQDDSALDGPSQNPTEKVGKYEELSDQTDMDLLRDLLDQAKGRLDLIRDEFSENDVRVRKQKLIVGAYAGMIADLDVYADQNRDQPELQKFRNNDQRKAFLKTYREWPVWFKVKEASEVYYRYDLPDGNSIVICEYREWLSWKEKYKSENPDSIRTREYLLKPGYHYLEDCKTNTSTLVEYLKDFQKEGRDG